MTTAISFTHLEHIIQSMTEALLIVNAQGIILNVNQAACQLLGYTEDELTDQSLAVLFPEETRFMQGEFETLIGSDNTNTFGKIETTFLAKNGRVITVLLSGSVIRNEAGLVQELIFLATDVTVHKKTIEALQKSQDQLQFTLASISDLIVVLNNNGVVVEYYLSDEDTEHHFPLSTGIGKKFSAALPMHVTQKWENALQQTIITSLPHDIDYSLEVKSETLWFNARFSTRKESTGEIVGVTVAIHNVTDAKRAEQLIQQKNEDIDLFNSLNMVANQGEELENILQLLHDRIGEIFSSYPGTVYLLNPGKTFLSPQTPIPSGIRHRIEKLVRNPLPSIGIQQTEESIAWEILQKKRAHALNDPESIQRFIAEHVKKPGLKKLAPLVYKAISIETLVCAPLFVKDEPVGLLVVGRDKKFTASELTRLETLANQVTTVIKSKQVEQSLKASEARFRSLTQSAADGILATDDELNIVSWNRGAESIFGYIEEEVLGKHITFIIPTQHHQPHSARNPQLFATEWNESFLNRVIDWRGLRKNGDIFDGETVLYSWKMDQTRFFGAIIRDVTARKEAERELAQYRQNLEIMVKDRTNELLVANAKLQDEISARIKAEESLQKHATELQSLNLLSRQVNTSLSLDHVVKTALKGISDNQKADLIMLFKMSGDKLIFQDAWPDSIKDRQTIFEENYVGHCLCGLAARDGKAIYSQNIHTDILCTREECKQLGMRSFAALPLLTGTRVLGVLGIGYIEEQDFHKRTDFLEALAATVAIGIQNANLHQRVQEELAFRKQVELGLSRRNRELQLLHQAGQQLTASLDLTSVLQTALDEVRQLLSSTASSIWLRDLETGETVCQEVSSPKDALVRGWRLAPGQGLIGWVLQHNQSLLVSDTRNDDRFFAGVDEMTGLVSRSVLTVPLRTIQGNLGALQILDKQIDKFSEADLQLVEALADSVAAAIGNSRLFAAEREHRRLAEVLRDTATSLNQNLDLEQVLDFVLDNVKRIIPCDIVNIMLVDSGIAHIVRYHGFMDCANEDDVKALHFSIDDVPHFHRMITSMQPCIIPDTSQDPDWVQLVPTHYVHSYIGVPIQRGKRTIGFINIDNLTTNVVTATHAKQLQDFANQAAMAIRNAQLYQLSQQEVANRLAAEREVQQQNEFLNMVMSSLTHPFYVVDVKDYSIIIANEAARKAGLPKGSTCYAVTHGRSTPCDGKEHPCPIKQILKTHQPATVEHLHHDSAGNQRNVMVYSYPIHDENGAITQIIEYTMDITEQVLSKQMLIQSEKFAATGKMAAAVAHEIKNPLQSLLGCLSLAQEAVKDGRETGKYFDVARDSVKRISGTVTQMRELYRPAAVNKEPVDINVLLDRMLTLIEKRCEESGVEIIWKPVKESLPLMLVFDEIHQVFLNLALNALEAMPNGGELHVETAFVEEPAGMQVVVADNGVGIAPDVLDHIFEPFYTTKSGGSGLGLATSFGIIKRHGGQIDVASKEGAGSAFTVWLPL